MAWLATHRLLLVVFGATLVLASFELRRDVHSGGIEAPRAYLEPGRNVADVSAALWPERALTLYYQAYQAYLCEAFADDPRTVCARRGPPAEGEVRALIERSLATGNRSIELAMYNYALVLVQEGAPEAEVAAAVRRWRSTYPGSKRPDPRTASR